MSIKDTNLTRRLDFLVVRLLLSLDQNLQVRGMYDFFNHNGMDFII